MKHWRIEEIAWDRFDPSKVDPARRVRWSRPPPWWSATAATTPATCTACSATTRISSRPPTTGPRRKCSTATRSAAGPAWPIRAGTTQAAFDRYRAGYQLPLDAEASVRGSRTGELIARCMVETGTSSYYTALADGTAEPVLKQICRHIAADEFRHFKLFYDHMKRYLARENIGLLRRLRIALGRIGESEDDELAYAWYLRQRVRIRGLPAEAAAPPPTCRARWRSTASATSSAAWA